MLAAWAYNKPVTFPRSSGILLHPTSLPGRFGIGDLGPEAYKFVDFLAAAGQRIWQVLPLGPTGYGDSPYQLFSAFAGNPLLISLDQLVIEGLLLDEELERAPQFPADEVDYGRVIRFRLPLLRTAYERFKTNWKRRDEFADFRGKSSQWLDDYALFMALKAAHGGEAVWSRWEPALAARRPGALKECGRSWRKTSKPWNSPNTCSSGSGGACTITPATVTFSSWATCPFTWRTTAPTCGPIPTCSSWMRLAIRR